MITVDFVGRPRAAFGCCTLDNQTIPPSCPEFMLLLSTACQAACTYCFGPHKGEIMSVAMLERALTYCGETAGTFGPRKIRVTFHGGEPLLAGEDLFRIALDRLSSREDGCDLGLQSNLWLLNDAFCELFAEHEVRIGSSLDGPQDITDRQRGKGYFAKTMAGVHRAHEHGLELGMIATFTPWSLERWQEVFEFFLERRLNFAVHAAVPCIDHGAQTETLTPEAYGRLLLEMFDVYLQHRKDISLSTFDQMCRSAALGRGTVCTFRDCLGMFLAIDPSGDIAPCQRLSGHPSFRLGSIKDPPSLDALMSSPAARRFKERQARIEEDCRECPHLDYCKGGCPYNAWAQGGHGQTRDPYAEAYRTVFDEIQRRLALEMASEENIDAIAEDPLGGGEPILLRRGPVTELAKGGRHPSEIAVTAKRIVAAVELARAPSFQEAVERLVDLGVARTRQTGAASLRRLERRIHSPPQGMNNLYCHVTFACQLQCAHCYAGPLSAAKGRNGGCGMEMSPESLTRLMDEAEAEGFRKVVITGGEPLCHSEVPRLLEAMSLFRRRRPELRVVLRTNFALSLTETDLERVARSADEVVVSLDGDEDLHDSRRGPGTFASALKNVEAYQLLSKDSSHAAELSFSAALGPEEAHGDPGRAVLAQARRLRVKRTRFRPLLPLGRAVDCGTAFLLNSSGTADRTASCLEARGLLEKGFEPSRSCGLGYNLSVEPNGASFPCHACRGMSSDWGNVLKHGLRSVLNSESFVSLRSDTVDSDEHCSDCEVRYLCSGVCVAWKAALDKSGGTPRSCLRQKAAAEVLLSEARHYLGLAGEEKANA